MNMKKPFRPIRKVKSETIKEGILKRMNGIFLSISHSNFFHAWNWPVLYHGVNLHR